MNELSTMTSPVAPRCGFLPPRFHITPLPAETAAAWAPVPPLVPLTNLTGTAVPERSVTLRLAYDAGALYLRAEGRDPGLTRKPELAADDPRFWTQDHVEWRVQLAAGAHLQVILTPDGRCWDNRGAREIPGALLCRGSVDGDAWSVEARLACSALGLPALEPGMTLRGLVAHTRWASGTAAIVCCTAAELGFGQAERFAEFVLDAAAAGPVMTACRPLDEQQVALTLTNPAPGPFSGLLTLRAADADGEATKLSLPVTVAAGGAVDLVAPFRRLPRRFTRLHLALVDGGGCRELGAVSLCGELPPLTAPTRTLVHPYLSCDADGLVAFRRKAALPVFQPLAARLAPEPADFDESHLPPPDERFAFAFDAASMHWGRVARETMLRDGAGGRRPAAARIWGLLSPEAQESFRAVAGLATATPAHLAVLLPACNALLRRRDLYEPAAFRDVHMPSEGQELLARGLEALNEFDLTKFNRILLQSSIECCQKFKVDLATRAGAYLPKWLLTGDPRLMALATRTAQAAADSMIPEASFHLHEGNAAPLLALAYDTFHPLLTAEERGHWRRLLTKLLDLYLVSARTGAWTVTAIPNANPVGNAGAGFLALALWEEEPEKAREAIGWIRRYIWHWLDYCFGADGGNTEGCQYWQYGAESWIRFAALYERFFGTDDGMLDHPALRHGMNTIRVALCNDGALHGVNDTIPVPCGVELAWYWAGRYTDSFALWYGDHAVRWHHAARAAGRPMPYLPSPFWALLCRPELPEAIDQPEPLPTAYALRSIEYGILRSGPEWNCRWTAGLKGSRPPYTHHNQADTGALFVDLRGERLLIDPGYYKPLATDHSLPLIAGVGPAQPTELTGTLIACESGGDLRYLACDSTAAYHGAARRVVRHLVLIGDEGMVLLEDILPVDADAQVVAQFQCGGEASSADGRTLLVRGTEAVMQLAMLTRPALALTVQPERSLHDTHWGYHFSTCRHFPATGAYQAEELDPLVMVGLDATAGAPGPCAIERSWSGLDVILPSGRRVGFRYTEGRWALIV
jgi:hypothetical protein